MCKIILQLNACGQVYMKNHTMNINSSTSTKRRARAQQKEQQQQPQQTTHATSKQDDTIEAHIVSCVWPRSGNNKNYNNDNNTNNKQIDKQSRQTDKHKKCTTKVDGETYITLCFAIKF